jgi:hypothetical protein
MIQVLIEQLIQVLRQTEQRYRQLLPIIETEKEMVRKARVEALGDIASEKEHLLMDIKHLENKRGHLLKQIAGQLSLSSDKLTLKELVRHIDPLQGRQLQQMRETLKSLLSGVRSVNNENRALVHHCLGLVRQALSSVSPKPATSSVYQATGSLTNGEGGGRLVSNIA